MIYRSVRFMTMVFSLLCVCVALFPGRVSAPATPAVISNAPTSSIQASPAANFTPVTATLSPSATVTEAPTFTPVPTLTPIPESLLTFTPLPTLTATYTPSATASQAPRDLGIVTATAFVIPSDTPFAPPSLLNGIPTDLLVVLTDNTKKNIRDIYACGQKRGNNSRAFSKIGDCNSEAPLYLTRFDEGPYNLSEYRYLQGVIQHYAGSYKRVSVAVHQGFHSWSLFDPMWADKTYCKAGENPITCEFRINRPTVALISLGTNDYGVPEMYERSMRQIVEFAIANGVIPVLATKADRKDGPTNIDNKIVRRIAADYNVPLWDLDLVAQTIPGSGLEADGIHMTAFYAHDYSSPVAFQRGHGVQNLTALMALDAVWHAAEQGDGTPPASCASS